ncbi:12118_t:CDS:2 [Entrophospora sp. SA101]|nr:12118_t:CDS:2 [Entrophospora sp. SA101]CAJ0877008.1 2924_t:CDS:2 [Entrophospora sp. SA101]
MISIKFNSFLISAILITILSTTNFVDCQAPGTGVWPPIDTPPPFDDSWATVVDFTVVPDAPVSTEYGDCPAVDTFCSWTCTKCIKPEDVVTYWAFTFDDGPTTATTTLLDYLDTINVNVTFFVVGSRVITNPQILKRAVDSGHQIGIHTWSHTALTTQTNEEIVSEIKWTERAIQNYAGVTPNLLRPPQGDYDDRIRDIARQLGYTIVLWELDSFDWMVVQDTTYPVEYITGNFTAWADNTTAKAGHITLGHDLYEETVDLAPQYFPIVTGKGFNVKTVGGCINKPDFNPLVSATTTTSADVAATTTPAAPTKRKRQLFKKRLTDI